MSSVKQLVLRGVSVFAVLVAAIFIAFKLPVSNQPEVAAANDGIDQAVIPGLSLSTSEINFGRVRLGEAESAIVQVTHAGPANAGRLVIDNFFLDELDSQRYSVNTSGPIDLAPFESYDLVIGFEPNEFGPLPGRLILNHTGVSAVEVIDLNGEGYDANEPVVSAAVPPSFPFGKSTLSGFNGGKPTSLQFGPDGRLYVAFMDGLIKVFDVERDGKNDYEITGTDTITSVKNILNHNDNGSKKTSLKSRLVTGILVTGTASEPVIYVQSSDPRIGGGHSGNTTGLDTNSGVISRLTLTGNGWQKLDLVRGLPRSEENHHGNGLAMVGSKLYLAAGGNTNMGASSNNFALLPEYALSAAILEIDLDQIGESTYDLPTLNDEDRAGKNDNNDPFGGNRGKNQAKLVNGGPVQVYAPGFRNAYDVIVMQNGKMYSWDNGPNSGWGGVPGNCSNTRKEPGNTQHDALHLISGKGYYGGHPNPTRGSTQNKFNNSNPQSPVPGGNSIECNYYGPGTNGNGKHNKNKSLVSLASSTNGLAEYTASNFSGDMTGNLLATSWDNKVYRVSFNSNGTLDQLDVLFSNVGVSPLDVTSLSDTAVFPGTIWVADFQAKSIVVYEPGDYQGNGGGVCVVTGGPGDADEDGFTNDDEIANGTDVCSAADIPADADADQISDLIDPDDDNDNIPDLIDPFALDSSNGANTGLNVDYQWENDSPDAGFIENLGFSGLMINGQDNYEKQYDTDEMTVIGAAGVVTIDNVTAGDPINQRNSLQYGFQFGVNASPLSPVFRAHTRILAPFTGLVPSPHQSMGLFIGSGDQDNYLKLVTKNNGIQIYSEVDGKLYQQSLAALQYTDVDYVDLIIEVDPASAIATGYYQVTSGAQTSDESIVASIDFPATWLTAPTKLAVGIISTSLGAQPFPATWDFLTVKPVGVPANNTPPVVQIAAADTVVANTPALLNVSVTDDGLPSSDLSHQWSAVSGPGVVNISIDSGESTTATFSEAGSYVLQVVATDGELETSASINVVVSESTTSTGGAVIYRINAGGPALSDANGDWQADTGGNVFVNTGKTWKSNASINTGNVDNGLPAAMFQTERYDKAEQPGLEWKLPVTPGLYQVRLYFSENYIGAMAPGGRVFDIEVEDQLIPALDVFAAVGANTAMMKAIVVQSDDELNIKFSRIAENPAIKGIEVIQPGVVVVPPLIPVTNQAPVVNAGSNQTVTIDAFATLSGAVTDDGLPNDTLTHQWSMVNGPYPPTFSAPTNLNTKLSFPVPGVYVLKLNSSDGALQDSDEIQFTVGETTVATNTAPVVSAGTATTGTVGSLIALSGTVTDDGLPSSSLTVQWSKQSGPGDVQFSNSATTATDVQFNETGNYVLRLAASDTELGSFDEVSIIVSDSAPVVASVVYRINAGGPAISDAAGNWLADNTGASLANTGKLYKTSATIDNSATPGIPADLFQTERWDTAGGSALEWKLPVTPGQYEVRLYFSEIYNGAWSDGARIFDVDVEGQALSGIDIYSEAGSNAGLVKTFVVSADSQLNIKFSHVQNNPAIKGIEVLTVATVPQVVQPPVEPPVIEPPVIEPPVVVPPVVPPANTAPSVNAGANMPGIIGVPLVLQGIVADDGLPDGSLTASWSMISGPGAVSFSGSGSDTTASFSASGTYNLQLAASDGVLSATDDMQVLVSAPIDDPPTAEIVYRINAGGPEISDATGNWAADVKGSAFVNTGKTWSKSVTINTHGLTNIPTSLFTTERYDLPSGADLSWELPVAPGSYEVKLYFAEIWGGAMGNGKRVFDLSVEGQSLSALDVFAEVGANTALVKTFTVSNTDGLIDIEFGHLTENPSVKGIEVIRQ